MKFLLDDRFAPITSEIGFIQCPVNKVMEAYLEWQAPIQAKRGVSLSMRQGRGSLPEALRTLLPLTSVERRRILFFQTASEWTAFFDNGWRGTDVFSAGAYLSKKLNCRGVRAVCVPNSLDEEIGQKKGRYGATMFELYSARQADFLNIERSISAVNDGGKWVFSTNGAQQPFEDPSRYKVKSIKDRFTPEMLDRYLQSLGIKAFDPEFYVSSDGFFLVEKVGPSALKMTSYSLEDARANWNSA